MLSRGDAVCCSIGLPRFLPLEILRIHLITFLSPVGVFMYFSLLLTRTALGLKVTASSWAKEVETFYCLPNCPAQPRSGGCCGPTSRECGPGLSQPARCPPSCPSVTGAVAVGQQGRGQMVCPERPGLSPAERRESSAEQTPSHPPRFFTKLTRPSSGPGGGDIETKVFFHLASRFLSDGEGCGVRVSSLVP